ncbi:hypothetical protein ACLOJK_027860 [Asimina triloba]
MRWRRREGTAAVGGGCVCSAAGEMNGEMRWRWEEAVSAGCCWAAGDCLDGGGAGKLSAGSRQVAVWAISDG